MSERRYRQYCPVARALEVVGGRWTLLVIRELYDGPKRYTDLVNGLPGVGTNLLADRLKTLEDARVVARRMLPPPAASSVYELTEYGKILIPVLEGLARFGMPMVNPARRNDRFGMRWIALAMRASFRPKAAAGLSESYEFRADSEVLHTRIDAGRLEMHLESAPNPVIVLSWSSQDLDRGVGRDWTVKTAIKDGWVKFSGDSAALDRCIRIFALPGADRREYADKR